MSKWVSEWVSEWMSEWVSEWVSESVSEWINEWVGGWMIEWVSEWVSEWVHGMMGEWADERWGSQWVWIYTFHMPFIWLEYNAHVLRKSGTIRNISACKTLECEGNLIIDSLARVIMVTTFLWNVPIYLHAFDDLTHLLPYFVSDKIERVWATLARCNNFKQVCA